MISQDHVSGTSDASQPSQERRNFEHFRDGAVAVPFLDAVFKRDENGKRYGKSLTLEAKTNDRKYSQFCQ